MRLEVCETQEDWRKCLSWFSHDFYHTWDYHQSIIKDSERALLFLLKSKQGDMLAFPLIERETSLKGKKDLLGAYGYAGPLFSSACKNIQECLINEFFSKLRSMDYVSLFSRTHPTLNQIELDCMSDSGEVVIVPIGGTVAEAYNSMRKVHRRDIRKLKKSELSVDVTDKPSDAQVSSFVHVYEETMKYLNAEQSYYFSRDYYERFFKSTDFKTYLIEVSEPECNRVIASAMMVNCGNIFQYHLSGTLPEFYRKYPMKLILGTAIELAFEQAASVFVLGGGVGGKRDSLFDFKYGFSKQARVFRTISKIIDPDAYDLLVDSKMKELGVSEASFKNNGFFPAYRNNNVC